MSAEVIARAFEPFFTTKEVGQDTGLGCSMVYGMARQSAARHRSKPPRRRHCGEAAVPASGDGRGRAKRPAAIGKQKPSKAERQPASVLVIDDDPDVRGFIVAALEEQGYGGRKARDGAQGLAETQREKADLVILDFIMPGLPVPKSPGGSTPRAGAADPVVSGYSETDAVKRIAPDAPLLPKPFRAQSTAQGGQGACTRVRRG